MKCAGMLLAIIFLIAVLGLIAVFGYYGWGITKAVVIGAKTLKPNIYVPLVITVLTASFGLSATLYTQTRTRKREIEAAFRERKIEIYLEFLESFAQLLLAQKEELNLPEVNSNDLAVKLVSIRTKAILWGSTGVLKALNEMTKVGEGNVMKMLRVMDKLQREMRKDLGLSTFGLEADFFSKLILTDDDDFEALK